MSIAPIVHRVQVAASPARAFELFVHRMADWWPKGGTPAAAPHIAIVIEPKAEGRWFERDAEGRETPWGKVLEWEPPSRVLLGWQLDSRFQFDPDLVTELELTFAPAASGGTEVTLEHRTLERFGADAERFAGQLNSGWPRHIATYAKFVEATGASASGEETRQ